jgi:hypothetical protein
VNAFIFFGSFILAAVSSDESLRVPIELPEVAASKVASGPVPSENFELSVSSWAPGLRLLARSRESLAMERNIPEISLTYFSSEGGREGFADFNFLAGLSYLSLSSDRASPSLHLISGKLGFQMESKFLEWKLFCPFGRMSILPTALLLKSSGISDEVSVFRLPLELSAGFFLKSPWKGESLAFRFLPHALSASFVQTLNTFGAEDLSGYGLSLGLAFAI